MTIAALRKEGFSEDAIRVVVLQNWLVDWYSGHADPNWFLSAYRYVGSESSFVPEVFRDHDDLIVAFETSYLHFDNLNNAKPTFHEVTTVKEYWTTLADATAAELHQRLRVKDPDVLSILSLLGISLHAVQDFYSHSNWVGSPTERDDNSDYDVTTWWDLASISPAPSRVRKAFTGSYGKNAQGVTHDALNKDNYSRNRWDRAYANAYWATVQWIRAFKLVVEHERPGFWAQCLQGTQVRGADSSVLDANLLASYEISEYLGKWKGEPSSQTQAFSSFRAFRNQTSIFTSAFSRQYVYAPLSRDLGHTDIRRGLPAGMNHPVFPTIPLDEDAVLLVVPEVKSLSAATYSDTKMFAKIRMSAGNLTQEFVENTEFDNSGNKPFNWKVLFFVPKNTSQVRVQVSLYNEGEISHDQDQHIRIGNDNGGYDLSFLFRPSDGTCTIQGNSVACNSSSPIASQGTAGHRASLKLYIEKRQLTRRPA